MNLEQVKSAVRSLVLFVAGLVGGIGVSKGWYTAEQLTSFLNSEFVLSLIAGVVTLLYGIFMNRPVGLMTAAANVNPESKMMTTAEKASASPAPNVMPAGTAQAKAAAATPIPNAT